MNNEELEQVNVIKYFIKLDNDLNFSEHIEYIIGKSLQKLAVIHKSRDSIGTKTALTLYKRLVVSQFEYCGLVFECSTKLNLNCLQLIQNQGC